MNRGYGRRMIRIAGNHSCFYTHRWERDGENSEENIIERKIIQREKSLTGMKEKKINDWSKRLLTNRKIR